MPSVTPRTERENVVVRPAIRLLAPREDVVAIQDAPLTEEERHAMDRWLWDLLAWLR